MQEVSRVTELAATIVAAHASRTDLESSALPAILAEVGAALRRIDDAAEVPAPAIAEAAVETGDAALPAGGSAPDEDGTFVRNGIRTVFDRHIVCLDDGKSVVLLERHLRRRGTAVADYLKKWDLPEDYPMVAPGYAAEKRALALRAGLGKTVRPSSPEVVEEPPRRRGTLHPSYGAVTSPSA